MSVDWAVDLRRLLKFIGLLASYGIRTEAGKLLGLEGARWAVAFRQFLESMGSTYLKLGQYLAIRFDLVPKEVGDELGRLFEGVPPVAYPLIRRQIEQALGQPIERLFESFEPTCIAAASIAQVHRAVSWQGRKLAVKVQRPGVDRVIAADLRNLRRMARLADALKITRDISLVDLIDEFAKHTLRELDFVAEGQTADLLRANIGEITIPEVIWPLSSRRVLTMTFVEGVSAAKLIAAQSRPSDVVAGNSVGLDVEDAVRRLASATLRQIFIDGVFHADPHPGNILIGAHGQAGLVDFGICGRLTQNQREHVRSYVQYLLLGDIDQSYRSYENLLTFSPHSDRKAFRREVKKVMWQWAAIVRDPSSEPSAKHVGFISDRKAALLYKYHVQFDVNTLLFWKTLIVLDGVALMLLPNFDLGEALVKFFSDHEPPTGERIYAALWNDKRIRGSMLLITDFAGHINKTNDSLKSLRPVLTIRRQKIRQRERQTTYAIKCLCLAVAALALQLVIESPSARLAVLAGGSAVAALFAGLSLRRMLHRGEA